jgi:AraC-like DNA-binding protein
VQLHVAGDFVVRPGSELAARQITDWELVYFPTPTKTRYMTAGKVWALDGPAIVLTPPQVPHSYQFDPKRPTRHLFVHFDWHRERLLGRIPDPLPAVQPAGRVPLIGVLLPEILYLCYCREPLWEDRASLLLAALLAALLARAPSAGVPVDLHPLPPSVQKALAYMDAHLDQTFQIGEMARTLGWSREHLAREFARYLGQSPTEVLTQKRLDRACALLQDAQLSVRQVAHSVGYGDATHFTRRFRTRYGMTPSTYQKRCAADRRAPLRDASFSSAHTAYPLNVSFHVHP